MSGCSPAGIGIDSGAGSPTIGDSSAGAGSAGAGSLGCSNGACSTGDCSSTMIVLVEVAVFPAWSIAA